MPARFHRGTGYLHRAPSLAERASSAWRSRRVAASFRPSLHPPFPELFKRFGPMDQGALSACTGFGVAMGATLQSVAGGAQREVALSPMLPYWAARRRAVKSDDQVRDEGAYVEDVVWAFNTFGALDDVLRAHALGDGREPDPLQRRIRDFVHAEVNQRPAPSEFRAALRVRSELQLRMRTIVEEGDRLLQRVAHSLHLGQVCFLALPVADSFLEPGPGVIPAQTVGIIGYHFVCLLDWHRNDFGSYEFLCGNSWGPEWALGGTAWLSSWLCKQTLGAWYLERVERPEAA